MAALEDQFYLLAPDYPGFGNTDMPDPAAFDYTFDRLSEITEGLLWSLYGLQPLRTVHAGLRRPRGQPDRRPPPGVTGVADRP
jgi:hypothetical protein